MGNWCNVPSMQQPLPVLLSKNWMCRSSWAVMVIGSVGWLSTLLILQGASVWRRTWEGRHSHLKPTIFSPSGLNALWERRLHSQRDVSPQRSHFMKSTNHIKTPEPTENVSQPDLNLIKTHQWATPLFRHHHQHTHLHILTHISQTTLCCHDSSLQH